MKYITAEVKFFSNVHSKTINSPYAAIYLTKDVLFTGEPGNILMMQPVRTMPHSLQCLDGSATLLKIPKTFLDAAGSVLLS
jgi:hypothetical protein